MKKIVLKTIKKIKKRRQSIAIAESFTGGLITSALISVKGASKIIDFGLVVYSNNSKKKILKIPNKILLKFGAVSSETCKAMCNNLYKISKAEICLATTGIAGPSGGSKKKPVGLIFMGVRYKNKIFIKRILFSNKKREYIQKLGAKKAFIFINEILSI